MSRSNWGKVFVVGLALVFSATIGAYLWLQAEDAETQSQNEAKDYAAKQANAAKIEAEAACKSVTPHKPCIDQNTKSDRPDERHERDVVAQETMAAWTKAMGQAAIVGMFVGMVGVYLIWQTWAETRKTTSFALKNLEAFQKVEAANIVPEISIVEGNISLSLVNTGKTPCTLLYCDVGTREWKEREKVETKLSKDAFRGPSPVTKESPFIVKVPEIDRSWAVARVVGGAIYQDVFGGVHLCAIGIDYDWIGGRTYSGMGLDFEAWEDMRRRLVAGEGVVPDQQ